MFLLPLAGRCARAYFLRSLSTSSSTMDPNRLVWVDLEVCVYDVDPRLGTNCHKFIFVETNCMIKATGHGPVD